jgi:hypothetical protein
MSRLTWPLIVFVAIAGIAVPISRWWGLSYWATMAILVGASLLNGFVAAVEDDIPGGFNNPDGTATPRYVVVLKWVFRGFVALATLGCVALAAAIIRDQR